MDDLKLQNLQFLGIYGILQETYQLIHQWRKVFTQITLVFILPYSLLFFVQKIPHEKKIIFKHTLNSTLEFLSIFSLFSTSAVVYTVACIYTARNVSLKQVIRVVPKIWIRLLVTFLCVFAFNFVALSVPLLIPVIAILIYGSNGHNFGAAIGIILFFSIIFYFVAFWYLTIIWQLSSVVSVFEESCGFKAMAKSKALLKGKIWMVTKLLMLLSLPFGVVHLLFYFLAFRLASAGVVGKGILGIVWVLLFLSFFLVKLVAETVVYFVCKSYHCESVDKLALSDHLQGLCLSVRYVRLKVHNNVQLEKLQVV